MPAAARGWGQVLRRLLLRLISALALIVALLSLASPPAWTQDAPGAPGAANSAAGAGAAGPLPFNPADPAESIAPAETSAQEPVPATSPEWERLAGRAETALEDGLASTAAFETLRADLVVWRARFQEAQTANQSRIATLKAQIAALGPAPTDGTTEAPEIAARRAELDNQLARLEAPRRAADEAYSRADSLIREVDLLIRSRQASALLKLGPSPLNPAHWPTAASELGGTLRAVAKEAVSVWSNRTAMADARAAAPAILGLLVLAMLLLLRGRRWLKRLGARLSANRSMQAQGAIDFVLSGVRALVLYGGFAAIQTAIEISNLAGHRGTVLVGQIGQFGLMLALALWVGGRIFPRGAGGNDLLALSPERRIEGRFFTLMLALMLWLIVVVRAVSDYEGYADSTRAVLYFPVLVVAGLCLARIGQLIGYPAETGTEPQGSAFRNRLARIVGRFVVVFGFLGPVLAAVGYQSAAGFLTFPAAVSLALLAFLVVVQSFATQIYGLLTGKSDIELREALMPVLFGMVLAVASLPFFALIWGARVADLTEMWTRMSEGFSIGDTTVSPSQFLTFLIVFAVGYGATRLIQGTLRATVLPKTRIDPGGRTAIVSGVGYVGMTLAGLLAITSTGISLTSLAFVAGALSVGIGFGLQNIVSNFVSGIIMLIERPVAEGDWIEVGGKMGIVRAISVRSTRIETFDKTDVIVPNADFISAAVTNWTRGNLTGRIIVKVGVAYGTDTRLVERILREIAEAHPLVTLNPAPSVIFAGFGADSLDFEVRAILRDVNFSVAAKSDIHHEIARKFAEAGIEIPFGQRDIWLRNPETLLGVMGAQAGGPAAAKHVAARPDVPLTADPDRTRPAHRRDGTDSATDPGDEQATRNDD